MKTTQLLKLYMRNLTKFFAVAAISLFNLSALAVPFSATIPDQIGPIAGPSFVGGVTSPGASTVGGAHLTFDLIGYGGIDGYGPRISTNDVFDNFSFLVNDPTIDGVSFGAWLNMGGSNPGVPTLFDNNPDVNPLNATLVSYTDNGFNQGGLASFSVDFTLLSGVNSFAFNYGLQPRVGEGWGLRNIVVSADILTTLPPVISSVPEPETYAMLLAGLGLVSFVSRRRKNFTV